MSTPKATHPLNSKLTHVLRCPVCWAIAMKRVGRLAAA